MDRTWTDPLEAAEDSGGVVVDLAGVVSGDLLVFVAYALDDGGGAVLVEHLDEARPPEAVALGES